MSLAALIKRLQNIMRQDSGVSGDAQRLEQMVWLIFLKVFDYKEEECELDDGYIPVIPDGYRWRDWANPIDCEGKPDVKNQMTGDELLDFVNNILIPGLAGKEVNIDGRRQIIFDKTDERSLLVKSIMADTNNYMKSGYLLREVINEFNGVDFNVMEETHQFNDMYETLLAGLQSAGNYGEYYTNRAITRFSVDKINPKLGETMADWACGTFGFGIDTLKYVEKQIRLGHKEDFEQYQNIVRGIEKMPLPYKLAVTNLLLHKIDMPNVLHCDSLAIKNFSEYFGDDLVDIAMLNPPYGGVALSEDKMSFPADMRSSETADLFVALTVKRLKKNGRAVIVLPDGFLFGDDNAKKVIKQYLLKECNLHTIIRLPQSCFAPYTSIATNLLFFDKGSNTQEIWYYRLDMPEGYKHFSKTKPMLRKHFECVDEWWDNRHEIVDKKEHEDMSTTYKSKCYSILEIEANGYNLDLCGYPVEEKIILLPEEIMENFVKRRADLDKLMDEKIAEIKALLGGN